MGEEQICRLCLEKLSGVDGEKINNVKVDMLKLLLVELPFPIQNLIICPNCFKKLQLYFDFKISCLNKDNQIKTLHMNSRGETLNLEINFPKQLFIDPPVKSEETRVCRFCLKHCIIDQSIYLDKMEQDMFFRDLIVRSFPEVDLSLSLEPVICFECMETLQSLFNFVVGCFDANEIIQHYVTSVELDEAEPIDLRNVRDFMSNLKVENDDDFNLIHIKSEEENFTSNNNDCDVNIKQQLPDEECNFNKSQKNNEAHHTSKMQNTPFFVEYYNIKQKKVLACYHCPYKTSVKATLVLHLLVHKKSTEIAKVKCDKCDFETKWRSSLRTHMFLHKKKTELQMYKCANCKYQSKFKKHLRRHMEIHRSKKFKCKDCPFTTKSLTYFRSHCKNLHTDSVTNSEKEKVVDKVTIKKMYKCTYCSYKTVRSYRIKEHIVKHQEEAPLFKCDFCSFQSKHKASVRHHQKTHKTDPEKNPKPCKIEESELKVEP